ncbi:MAG: hypothetical protein IPN95_19565 [Bacteroidetes bacterium]|nr:hypothetical protein [Bacteroidota bacterium]
MAAEMPFEGISPNRRCREIIVEQNHIDVGMFGQGAPAPIRLRDLKVETKKLPKTLELLAKIML